MCAAKVNKERHTFSGNQTFPLKILWPYKVYTESLKEHAAFTGIEGMRALGLGSNMVLSALYWVKAIGVIDSYHKPTPFAKIIFGTSNSVGLDPYGESLSTLWLYHWNLANNRFLCSSIWFIFNKFNQNVFTREDLCSAVIEYAHALVNDKKVFSNISDITIKKDLEGILKTYCPQSKNKGKYGNKVKDMRNIEDIADSALSVLNLIRFMDANQSSLMLQRSPKDTLKSEIFAYCLICYWQSISSQLITLDYPSIRDGEGSPGLIFRLDDNSLVSYLEDLSIMTNGIFEWSVQTGIRNVVYRGQENDEQSRNLAIDRIKNKLIVKAITDEH